MVSPVTRAPCPRWYSGSMCRLRIIRRKACGDDASRVVKRNKGDDNLKFPPQYKALVAHPG